MKAMEEFFRDFKNTLGFALTLIGLVLAYFTFDNYMTSKIDERIKDTKYINDLSTTLRPFLIFDQDGVITYDHGAIKYIDSISVKNYDKDIDNVNIELEKWAKEITIFTNQYFQSPPLLDFIGVYHYTYTPRRKKSRIWVYEMRPIVYEAFGSEDKMGYIEPLENMYILEVLF